MVLLIPLLRRRRNYDQNWRLRSRIPVHAFKTSLVYGSVPGERWPSLRMLEVKQARSNPRTVDRVARAAPLAATNRLVRDEGPACRGGPCRPHRAAEQRLEGSRSGCTRQRMQAIHGTQIWHANVGGYCMNASTASRAASPQPRFDPRCRSRPPWKRRGAPPIRSAHRRRGSALSRQQRDGAASRGLADAGNNRSLLADG